uniref:C-type lectin domain-containing protein n=1 Tax=Ascaris lumbricoides TaxID=6252 RepID=A0A0M3HKY0_ASCLU
LHEYGEHTPYWIGLEEHNGEKFWATGRKAIQFFFFHERKAQAIYYLDKNDFTNWAPGEPSGKGKCTVADADKGNNSLWSAERCDSIQSKYFSCQKRACKRILVNSKFLYEICPLIIFDVFLKKRNKI